MRNLGLSDRNPRELRDTANGGGIDGHYIRPLTANSARRIAEGAFAPQPRAAASASHLAQPRQRRARQRPGKLGCRHLAAKPHRLPGPEIGEIDLAELLRRRLQGRQADCGTSANVPGCSAKFSVRNMPRWPPASAPCAMMASTPFSSSQIASFTMVADEITTQPAALTRLSSAVSGRPKWKLTISGFSSS